MHFLDAHFYQLFTGGYNFHGYYEYAVAEEMEKAKEVIINIVKNNK